jgi:hypothetical protein
VSWVQGVDIGKALVGKGLCVSWGCLRTFNRHRLV